MNAIGNAGLPSPSWGLASQLAANMGKIRADLNGLIQQASTGRVSDTYAGLGAAASTSILLRPAVAHLAAWQSNIDGAATRMQVAQTSLKQISQIASDFRAEANNLNGVSGTNIDTIAASARLALQQVAGLLNTTSGGTYVFSGQDSGNPAVPDAENIATSGFATQIGNAVAGLAANGPAATLSSILSIAGSNAVGTTPFSAALSQPASALAGARPSVQVGQGQSVVTGIVAGTNSDVPSGGAATTGSYIRDIMAGLATIGGLSSAQATDSSLTDFATRVGQSLADAVSALNGDAGVLGNRQTALDTTKSMLGDTATALQAQVSGAEDVDMASTLSRLSAVQTQLQASYQMISALQGLSLVKFLPAGG